MGLDIDGFTPETYEQIVTRMQTKMEVFSPGFDFSPESPDGALISIMAFEVGQAWNELDFVYNSYNPRQATGAGLRNLGLITGLPYGVATRSGAIVDLIGTAGTVVPKNSIVTDSGGNEFAVQTAAIIPSSVQVLALISGAIPVTAGTIDTVSTVVAGWSGIDQPADGRIGSAAQNETAFRNVRNRTVMRNFVSVTDTMQARLVELGIEQATVQNNDHPTNPLPDGTPAQTIHVTVGEVGDVTDEQIAQVILNTKGLACPTYGSTTIPVDDQQGFSHDVNFTKATQLDVYIKVEVTFLDEDFAGAVESIKADLVAHVNALLAGEDIIHSRLYGIITPYGKAQVDLLEVGYTAGTTVAANLAIAEDEFASTETAFIDVTVNNA